LQKCNTGRITICPADRALYDVRSFTCESKLYFQTTTKDGPCKRSLILHYESPTLLRHGEAWIYHFPRQRQVTIRCPRDNTRVEHTRTLSGAGLIHNAKRWSITSGELSTLPELHGVTHANIDTQSAYVPDSFPIVSRHELPRVEAALASEVSEMDQLTDRLAVAQKSLDVDTLVYIQKTTLQQEARPHWHLIIAAVSCMLTVLLALGIFLRSKFQCATSRCPRADNSTNATLRSPTHPVPASENPTATVYSEPQFDNVTFATYALTRNTRLRNKARRGSLLNRHSCHNQSPLDSADAPWSLSFRTTLLTSGRHTINTQRLRIVPIPLWCIKTECPVPCTQIVICRQLLIFKCMYFQYCSQCCKLPIIFHYDCRNGNEISG
jgi:hypothetical protein